MAKTKIDPVLKSGELKAILERYRDGELGALRVAADWIRERTKPLKGQLLGRGENFEGHHIAMLLESLYFSLAKAHTRAAHNRRMLELIPDLFTFDFIDDHYHYEGSVDRSLPIELCCEYQLDVNGAWVGDMWCFEKLGNNYGHFCSAGQHPSTWQPMVHAAFVSCPTDGKDEAWTADQIVNLFNRSRRELLTGTPELTFVLFGNPIPEPLSRNLAEFRASIFPRLLDGTQTVSWEPQLLDGLRKCQEEQIEAAWSAG